MEEVEEGGVSRSIPAVGGGVGCCGGSDVAVGVGGGCGKEPHCPRQEFQIRAQFGEHHH